MSLTVIILTYNEEKHLERCLESIVPIADEIYVVDSYSTDKTLDIGKAKGAVIRQNTFVNYALQFQWALDNCPIKSDWIMRMDADEYLKPELVTEIKDKLPSLSQETTGVILKRQVHFMGRWIKYGGYYPIRLLRIWRNGVGAIEQRWMDEHIKLSKGKTVKFNFDFVDDNLNNLSWWTDKHNKYATREAIDLLNKEYQFFQEDSIPTSAVTNRQDEKKRWYKNNLYLKSPLFLRAFLYFCFRYFIQLGFLDGKQGLIWHFLQGFWYRFLVDAKIIQIKYIAKLKNQSIKETIIRDFDFTI